MFTIWYIQDSDGRHVSSQRAELGICLLFLYQKPKEHYLYIITSSTTPGECSFSTTPQAHLPNRPLTLRLLLLHLPHIHPLPQHNRQNTNRHKRTPRNDHLPLDIRIRHNNRISNLGAHGIILLNDKRAIDRRSQILAIFRQSFVEFGRQDVGPECASNGLADGGADGPEHAPEGNGHGDFLMGDGGHDGELRSGSPDSRADAVEYLAHY